MLTNHQNKLERQNYTRQCLRLPCYDYSAAGLYHHDLHAKSPYLISLLNTNFITWCFKNFYAGGGLGTDGFRYKKQFLINLPIPQLSAAAQKPFISLVNKILAAKKANSAADTTDLEKKIDVLVYGLYGLTEEEIVIVEEERYV